MAGVRAGVYTETEVNTLDDGSFRPQYMDKTSPHFWATIWFLVALFLLFVL